jgi:hypothetical protein
VSPTRSGAFGMRRIYRGDLANRLTRQTSQDNGLDDCQRSHAMMKRCFSVLSGKYHAI